MVNDISANQAQAIVVAESPHYDEVAAGLPLMGVSGRVVSRVLIGMDIPIGRLCQSGQVKLSIVNTFRQPLKFDTAGELRPPFMKDIDAVQYNAYSCYTDYKDEIKRILHKCPHEETLNEYARRISAAVAVAATKRLVVCGLIAQSVFEYAFRVRNWRFVRPFPCEVGADTIEVFYVWHPSPQSGSGMSEWENPANRTAIGRLKRFVSANTLLQKITRVEITLDDNVPEDMDGIIRCGAIQSFDAHGRPIKDHQDVVDNAEYHSRNEMISDVAVRLAVSKDTIVILE